MTRPVSCLLALATAATLVCSATLAAQKKDAKKKAGAPAPVNLVWPLPPEQPRVRYLTSYRGEIDFDKKKESKFKALLLGPEEPKPMVVMVKPYGVAVDAKGVIYVTDTVQGKVFVIDPAARKVDYLAASGQGKVRKPIGVAVDSDGKVFVADASLNRVFGFDAAGNLVIAIGHEGELENPSGLAIDSERKLLYVADSRKHAVFCYSSVDGTSVRQIGGGKGKDGVGFNFPTNLFVDRTGRLFVADTLNFRVQMFDAEGRFIQAFGDLGDNVGEFARPKGVGVDSDGHVYVADANFHNFQILQDDGRPLLVVGRPGRDRGEFLLPAGLFVDQQDRIYVADQGNARIQVFQYLKAKP